MMVVESEGKKNVTKVRHASAGRLIILCKLNGFAVGLSKALSNWVLVGNFPVLWIVLMKIMNESFSEDLGRTQRSEFVRKS